MLFLYQVAITTLSSDFLYRQLGGLKSKVSSVYTLLPQKETVDRFTVFIHCAFTLDEI